MKKCFWQLGNFLLITLILMSVVKGAYTFPFPPDHVEANMGDSTAGSDRHVFKNIPPNKGALPEKDTEEEQRNFRFIAGKSSVAWEEFRNIDKLPYDPAPSHKKGERFHRLFLLYHCLQVAYS